MLLFSRLHPRAWGGPASECAARAKGPWSVLLPPGCLDACGPRGWLSSVQLPEAMLVSGLCCHLRPCWCLWWWWQWWRDMVINVCGPCYHWRLCWFLCYCPRDVDVHGPFDCQKIYGCSWPGLPPEAMLMSVALLWPGALLMDMAHDTSEGHVDGCGLCCCQKSCCCLWPVLSLKTMIVSMVCIAFEDQAEVVRLPLEAMWMSVVRAVLRNNVEIYDPSCLWL